MICYGTLPGAVRDKGFIAHDDDVDMLLLDDSSSTEEMRANALALIERYGPDRRLADPYHEWPWPVRDGVEEGTGTRAA